MQIVLLSPLGLLVALVGALPLLALARLERRAAVIRRTLRLGDPGRRGRITVAVALAAVAVLLGLAAAQPVIAKANETTVRTDAEMLFVFDTSRSMQAAVTPHSPTRLDRAKRAALQIRAQLAEVPAGAASMTQRTLPYMFPSSNVNLFAQTLRQSVRILDPPPIEERRIRGVVTTLDALAAIPTKNYFTPGVQRRVLIVLSDFETLPFAENTVAATFRRTRDVEPIYIRFWDSRERVFLKNGNSAGYVPDPTSAASVRTLASLTGGQAFNEHQLGDAVDAVRADIGNGPARGETFERTRTQLAAWFAAAALVPLALLLFRRNL
jgi:hypothetical protein